MYMFSAGWPKSLVWLEDLGTGRQKKPRHLAGLRYERGSSKRVLPLARRGSVPPYSSMVRISPSTSPRRLVKRAAAAPLITR